jgi:hypothetical protein
MSHYPSVVTTWHAERTNILWAARRWVSHRPSVGWHPAQPSDEEHITPGRLVAT